ncbi:hypothetical protein GCM10010196_04720 [Agromyces mediolanus]|uniref:Uncharacterized protein n=1 Tax=Agromyces mediolanus TaxID=41986 RepID=A0A918FA47_AGRME|nr:hypothetical protein GCM10010196_04720 [Agromyces mediolanus]GLJ73455.1 hypothetical protein GCM10017583_27140 [Agromyces mediolanus]
MRTFRRRASSVLEARGYLVYDGDQLALELREGAGILVSLSAPPPMPGSAPVTHPFASATFRMAANEGELGALLRTASDLGAFLDQVEARGYRVERSGS